MEEIPDDYEYLGCYAPPEAERLLGALEAENIGTHAEFHDGAATGSAVGIAYGDSGVRAQILISTESTRRSDVDQIHIRIFGSGLPAMPDETNSPEKWLEEEGEAEFKTLERRQQLVDELDDIERGLKDLLQEATAVKRELDDGSQGPDRLAALRSAFERHSETSNHLQSNRDKLEAELEEIDKVLYGEKDEESAEQVSGGKRE